MPSRSSTVPTRTRTASRCRCSATAAALVGVSASPWRATTAVAVSAAGPTCVFNVLMTAGVSGEAVVDDGALPRVRSKSRVWANVSSSTSSSDSVSNESPVVAARTARMSCRFCMPRRKSRTVVADAADGDRPALIISVIGTNVTGPGSPARPPCAPAEHTRRLAREREPDTQGVDAATLSNPALPWMPRRRLLTVRSIIG
jgi:hypothetical protein